MKAIIRYSRFGVDLDVPEGASKDEMIMAYLRACGGPEGVLNHFLRYASFIKATIPDAVIIKESKNKETKDE